MEDWFIEMYTPCMAVFAKRTALGRGHQGSVWAFYGVVNGNCYGCKLLHSGLCQSFTMMEREYRKGQIPRRTGFTVCHTLYHSNMSLSGLVCC